MPLWKTPGICPVREGREYDSSPSVRGEKHPSIQISPMIDMVFLLLIFFIVCTMYMTQQKGVPVELPAGRDSCSRKPRWK